MAHRAILDRPGYLKDLPQTLIRVAEFDPVWDLAWDAVKVGKFTEDELRKALSPEHCIPDPVRMKFLNYVRDIQICGDTKPRR